MKLQCPECGDECVFRVGSLKEYQCTECKHYFNLDDDYYEAEAEDEAVDRVRGK